MFAKEEVRRMWCPPPSVFETLLLLIFYTTLSVLLSSSARISLSLLYSRVMRRVCDLIITLCYSVFVVVVVVVVTCGVLIYDAKRSSFSSNLAALLCGW